MSPMVRVVKVGGSLLDESDLAEKLRGWLAAESLGHHVLVVGGGRLADAVREMDRRLHLGDEAAHWLAVRTMSITAELLSHLLPEVPLVTDFAVLGDRLADRGATIFDPWSFLTDHEPDMPGTRLVASWDVTSDAIAARLAVVLGAAELVLLKSAPPPSVAETMEDLAERGYVDKFFCVLFDELASVYAVDFRRSDFPATPLGKVRKKISGGP